MDIHTLYILFGIIFTLVTASALYLLTFAVASLFRKRKSFLKAPYYNRIAVLVPAYKEDRVIVASLTNILQQEYPRDRFTVFVAAHLLANQTIETLREFPITLVELDAATGSKAYSLQTLLNFADEASYDIALVLDADNHLEQKCLNVINDAFASGIKALQLHRVAKNENTRLALFDSLTEEINNAIFRKGPSSLNLSASTIGSGMAFQFSELKRIYNIDGIINNPACDREVDYETMRSGNKIEYIDDAYVYDEKVQYSDVFVKQRTRWMESQLWHIGRFLRERNSRVFFTADFINKLISNLVPSRMILLVVYIVAFVIIIAEKYLHVKMIWPATPWWIASFSCYLLALIIAIPKTFQNGKLLNVVLLFPRMIFYYIKALSKLRPGRKTFEHTPKTFDKN